MNFIKNIDRKLLKRFGIIIGIIVILFIILIIFLLISGSRLSYKDIESKMISAAKEYYSDNTKELPKTDNGVVSVSADKLAEGKYMKSLDKLVKNKSAIWIFFNLEMWDKVLRWGRRKTQTGVEQENWRERMSVQNSG